MRHRLVLKTRVMGHSRSSEPTLFDAADGPSCR